MEGFLAKVYEGSSDGIVAFSALGLTTTLGSGGLASKSSFFKIPLAKPSGCKVNTGILSVSLTAPPTVKTPFRWRLELDGLTISREAKPQFTVPLEDSMFYKIVFDVKPVLASKGEHTAIESHVLRASYDSAHPITIRELSLFKVYSKPRLEHSALYLTGAIALDPGDSYSVSLSTPRSLGDGDRLLVLTLIIPSPRINLNLRLNEELTEISGHGFKLVEIPSIPENVRITIEYPKPEISIYPKRVLLTNVLLVENKTPVPPLRIQADDVAVEEGKLKVKLTIANEGSESAEDVSVTLKHAMLNLKEAKLGSLEPGEVTSVVLEAETSRIPTKAQRLTIRVSWAKDGIMSSRSIVLDVR